MPPMKARYIRDWINGNNLNAFNQWVEIQVFNLDGVNVALGKTVTCSTTPTSGTSTSYVTNGTINAPPDQLSYLDATSGLQYVTIDLGAVYDIARVYVWHYFLDGRTYNATRTAGSLDASTWTDIYNSATSGTYPEGSGGRLTNLIPWQVPVETHSYVDGITEVFFNRVETDTAALRLAPFVLLTDAGGYYPAKTVESGIGLCTNAIGFPQWLYIEEFNGSVGSYQVVGTTINSVSGSIINVTSTNADPMIRFVPAIGTGWGFYNQFAARYFVVRYRYISGTAPNTMEFFFTNQINSDAVGSQVVTCPIIADGQWHIATVDGWANVNWKVQGNGVITGVRFDWCTTSGTTMEFDYIGLQAAGVV